MSTLDGHVRAQIEATKDHLRRHGLRNVDDPSTLQGGPDSALHTIVMMVEQKQRVLRVSYAWLEARDAVGVERWLAQQEIAKTLELDPDATEMEISSTGLIRYPKMG